MDEWIDRGMQYNSHRRIRVWKPGDGLTCSHTRKASRYRPCGPPVAVQEVCSHPQSSKPHNHREILCAYHLSTEMSPGALVAHAERMAKEEVVVAHWDEYQAAVERYVKPKMEELIGDLPDNLKIMVLEALQRHEEQGNG
jgi:hypothetical protein